MNIVDMTKNAFEVCAENTRGAIYGGSSMVDMTKNAFEVCVENTRGAIYGGSSVVVEQGTNVMHQGVGFVHEIIDRLQQQTTSELGSRLIFLATGVTTGVTGVWMLRNMRIMRTTQEKVFQASKAVFWLGASAICIGTSYFLPALSNKVS